MRKYKYTGIGFKVIILRFEILFWFYFIRRSTSDVVIVVVIIVKKQNLNTKHHEREMEREGDGMSQSSDNLECDRRMHFVWNEIPCRN